MKNLNRQLKTVFVPKFVAKAGKHMTDLRPFELALVDCESGITVNAAKYCSDRKYELVMKTGSQGMNNAMFGDTRNAQLPIKSLAIDRVTKAHSFEDADPNGKPFIAYLGWDGVSNCKTLSLPCGEEYALNINIKGEGIRNTFGRNMNETIPFDTGCCDDCPTDQQCDLTMDAILKSIRKNSFYVKNYFKVNKVKSCCPESTPFPKKRYMTFRLTLCDNGDSAALADVQAQYPDLKVECVNRVDSFTTYEVCLPCEFSQTDQDAITVAETDLQTAMDAVVDPDNVTAAEQTAIDTAQADLDTAIETAEDNANTSCTPDDFVQTQTKILVCDECPDCPDTLTKVEAGDKYVVCFTDTAVQAVAPFAEFESEDTTVSSAAIEDLAATFPGYNADSASILGFDCGKVTLQLCVTVDTDVSAFADGTSTKIGECKGMCKGENTVEWCEGDEKYKISRKQCIVVKNDDCEVPVSLEEVMESLMGADIVDGTLVATNGKCNTRFEVEQCNNACLEDGCDTYGKDGAKFDRLPAFNGHIWKDCDCEGWSFDGDGCPIAPTVDLENCLCGLKFESNPAFREILECVHDITDNIEREPYTIEVSLVKQEQEDSKCDPLKIDWTVVQYGTHAEGDGRFAFREEVISRNYDGYIYVSPKQALGSLIQKRLGYEYAIDPSKFYNSISLYHNYDRDRTYHKFDASTRELIKIFVERDNVVLLEQLKTFFNATLMEGGACNLL